LKGGKALLAPRKKVFKPASTARGLPREGHMTAPNGPTDDQRKELASSHMLREEHK